MSVVLGLWHLVLEGGQEKSISAPACIQITNISYGEKIADPNCRDVIKLEFEALNIPDEEEEEPKEVNEDGLVTTTTVLCALSPGKIEHATLNVVLDNDAEYKFKLSGKNTVYLTGHYIRQNEDEDVEDSDEDSEDEFSDEDAYDLREVSSDVEMHPDDLEALESDNSRFEEVVDEPVPTKGQKRIRSSEEVTEEPKAEKKKKNKKLKAEDGKPVEVAAEAQVEAKKEKKDKKDKKVEETSKADDKKEKPKKTLAGGIVVQDHKVGTGPMAKKGNTVRMRYVGKLTNGKEFDKNVSGKPFTFHLGKGEVIKGWDEGIVGMQVGGERVLTIPPAMGYGSKKAGTIPPNSTLVFEVKLLEIK